MLQILRNQFQHVAFDSFDAEIRKCFKTSPRKIVAVSEINFQIFFFNQLLFLKLIYMKLKNNDDSK